MLDGVLAVTIIDVLVTLIIMKVKRIGFRRVRWVRNILLSASHSTGLSASRHLPRIWTYTPSILSILIELLTAFIGDERLLFSAGLLFLYYVPKVF